MEQYRSLFLSWWAIGGIEVHTCFGTRHVTLDDSPGLHNVTVKKYQRKLRLMLRPPAFLLYPHYYRHYSLYYILLLLSLSLLLLFVRLYLCVRKGLLFDATTLTPSVLRHSFYFLLYTTHLIKSLKELPQCRILFLFIFSSFIDTPERCRVRVVWRNPYILFFFSFNFTAPSSCSCVYNPFYFIFLSARVE